MPRTEPAEDAVSLRRALDTLGIARRAGHAVTGTRSVMEAARAGRLVALLVARDAAPRALERVSGPLGRLGVPAFRAGGREELGRAVGRDHLVVVGLTDTDLAAKITAGLPRAEVPWDDGRAAAHRAPGSPGGHGADATTIRREDPYERDAEDVG